MKMAQLNLPMRDNDGLSLTCQHATLRRYLLDRFGGYTAIETEGGWRHDGRNYIEPILVYQIAMERQRVVELRELAATIAGEARQECVMIVTPCGDVEFVKPREK